MYLKNIIIVNDYAYTNGGASKVAIVDAVELAKKGYNVIFFASVGPVQKGLESIKNLKIICLEKYDILNNPNRIEAIKEGIWNHISKQEFKKILSTLDPSSTIIHVHGISKSLSSSVIREALDSNFKIIYHMHDFGLACPNLGFYNYQKQEICTLKAMSFKCLCTNCDSRAYSHKIWRIIRQFVQEQFGLLPKDIKHFIAVSNFSYKILERYIPKNANVHLIHNPINVDQRDFAEREIGNYFIFVGRLSKEKDPITPAIAAKKLGIPIIFVGDGELKEEIRKVNEDAEVLGWLPNDHVIEHIRKARALIMSSRWYETQGMVVSEAMACGVPAIVAETSAASEFIINGKTGLTFKTGDFNDLANKMSKLLDHDLAFQMSQLAFDTYWKDPFTIERHIDSLIQLYEEVLNEGD
ncbi:Glycosyltransferase [Geobacillus stearothermophilus]|uniref:Glycosyltransferase n=1 Tax=Geobacillus stearothermophilus TaxID=1422 RepID=A0ABQ7HJQ6_GEOSE|nr:glycosyltransferase family 4 protein [Geobacillus stearothermophilus]KAF6512384.1 Glycosyltransferase [Geobacillus stearothermophilus]